MEKRQIVMIAIVVVCLIAAGVIFFVTQGGGGGGAGGGGMVLLMCGDTGKTFEMEAETYREKMLEVTGGQDPMMNMMMNPQPIGIPCDECGGKKAFLAYKDPQTGEVRMVGMPPAGGRR